MLDDQEYEVIEVALRDVIYSIKAYRKETGASLDKAMLGNPTAKNALAIYEELTEYKLDNYLGLYYVKRSKYGPICPSCDKPFRTPRASFCAECGYDPAHI